MSVRIARKLRSDPTEAEARLWSRLRHKQIDGHRFRRQASIGPYVADFLCPGAGLIIEVDGGQHASESAKDSTRTAWLSARGYRVLRFWNNEVLQNTDGVIERIRAALDAKRIPPP